VCGSGLLDYVNGYEEKEEEEEGKREKEERDRRALFKSL
jgi:hypothetical protein